jgi:hypothetical protein
VNERRFEQHAWCRKVALCPRKAKRPGRGPRALRVRRSSLDLFVAPTHAHDPPCDPQKRWRRIDLLPGTSLLTEYSGSPVLVRAEAVTFPCRFVGSFDEGVALQRRRVHAGDLHGAASFSGPSRAANEAILKHEMAAPTAARCGKTARPPVPARQLHSARGRLNMDPSALEGIENPRVAPIRPTARAPQELVAAAVLGALHRRRDPITTDNDDRCHP